MPNIIIGGTHGLGWEIAQNLRERGEECFVVGRSYDAEKHGDGAKLDLNNREAITKFISENDELLKNASGFYWCAAFGYKGDFASQENVQEMVDVNLANVLPIAHKLWQGMVANNAGNFVVVSSTTGVKARADEATYALTKHAQTGFTRSLGLEAERLGTNIHVRLIIPGGMKTPFWNGEEPDGYESYNDPAKVAKLIVDGVYNQENTFEEQMIERGQAA